MTQGSVQYYVSRDGDVLDQLLSEFYGREVVGQVEAVLEGNPGLAELGPVLPAGVRIAIPYQVQPTESQGVSLWD